MYFYIGRGLIVKFNFAAYLDAGFGYFAETMKFKVYLVSSSSSFISEIFPAWLTVKRHRKMRSDVWAL